MARKPKRHTEAAVRKVARPNNDDATGGETTVAMVDMVPGDTAWNPHGDDISEGSRVIYYFHENGDPPGVMIVEHEVPPIG